MQIIASDLLVDLCGLSLGLIFLVLIVGFVLWLFGWWSHRFWIVLLTTVLAGIFGLNEATSWRAQPIVVAVLLAIAAGVLALAVVRVIALVSGGIAGLYLLQMLFPAVNQPAIAFLVSGLLCLFMFRWCFMAVTSLTGSVLMMYAGLGLLHHYECFDVVNWSEENSLFLNSLGGFLTVLGLAFQFLLHRWRASKENDSHDGENPLAIIVAAFTGKGKSKSKAA